MFPWTHWKTIVPLGAGAGGLLLFILWSSFVPNEPILRGSMFKSPTALVSYFGTVVHGMFLWSALYYMYVARPRHCKCHEVYANYT
jgi:hypothetical protein